MGCYERIKKCANERKISITNLEKECGFGNGTIGKWQKHNPILKKLQVVADYFGKPIEYFLNGDNASVHHNGNVLTNCISESDNAILFISGEECEFSKQELELVAAYRTLGIEKQAKLIQYLLQLKSDKSENN